MSRVILSLALVALTLGPSATVLQGQGSLLRRSRLTVGPSAERINFNDVLPRDGDQGRPIKSLQQIAFPVGATLALGSRITLDVGAAWTNGEVEYDDGSTAAINGISDVRARATIKVLGDGLVLSLGGNLPAGATSLDDEQLQAVRVLASPGFALQLPAVGFGPAGSVGLVATRPIGAWVGALGVSYEYRGTFSPVAALQAGAEPDFDPGNSTHLSLGLDGFVGDSRLTLQATADVYTNDVLSTGSATTQTLKLGPVLTLEGTLALGTTGIRDGRLYAAVRSRGSLTRDGTVESGSDGLYLSGGIEGGLPMGRVFDLHLAADVLSQTGLEFTNTLMGAQATGAGLLVGLRARGAAAMFEPFVRAGIGSIDPGAGASKFSTLSAGVTLVMRF